MLHLFYFILFGWLVWFSFGVCIGYFCFPLLIILCHVLSLGWARLGMDGRDGFLFSMG